MKFTRGQAPLVHITTKVEGDCVVLSVRDKGTGIPQSGMDKIFDMYGRLSVDVEGHGVGLYLANKIVNAAGGHIVVESEVGVGTTFMICLKIATQHAAGTSLFN
jgi:two-component system CheB/CheR fusion protein